MRIGDKAYYEKIRSEYGAKGRDGKIVAES